MSDPSSFGSRQIGDYELIEELGRGGMGVVYRARQASLNREVALKIVLGGEFTSDVTLARFRQEALTAAELSHPNIVRIYDVGEHEGQPYFTMDLVAGCGLDAMCATRPLAWEDAARYVRILAEAVDYAHDRGVLHRDLKPQNVLIDEFDMPRILDFGLARRLDAPSGLTVSGTLVGTPSYMPPELALGQHDRMGRQSDVYGLGAILYELLTIRPPIVEASIAKTLESVVRTEPIPPRRMNPDIPRDLETVCLKCLEKAPERRYATARALAEDLGRVQRGEPIRAKAISLIEYGWRWCARNRAVASLSAAVLGLLVATSIVSTAAWVRTRQALHNEERARENAMRERARARDEERRAIDLLAQLDMKEAAHAAAEGYPEAALAHLARSLRVNPRDRAAAAMAISLLSQTSWARLRAPPLAHAGEVQHAEFSPDGRLALTVEDGGLVHVWEARTGRLLAGSAPGKVVRHAAFNRTGTRFAVATADGEARVWETTAAKPVTPALVHGEELQFIEFSPDDRHLATISNAGTLRVWAVPEGRREAERAIDPSEQPLANRFSAFVERGIRRVRFSPDGTRILTAAGTRAQLWDARTFEPVSPPLTHESNIQEARFDTAGARFVTACLGIGQESYAQVWDTHTGAPVGPRLPHRFGASTAMFGGDNRLVTGSLLGTVRVWNAADAVALTPWIQGFDPGASISDNGALILHLPRMGIASVLDVDLNRSVARLSSHRNSITSAAFAPGNRLVITGSNDRSARLWDLHPTKVHPIILPHGVPVDDLRFGAGATSLLAVTRSGAVRLWDLASGTKLAGSEGLVPGRITDAACTPAGTGFVAVVEDGSLYQVRDGAARVLAGPQPGRPPPHGPRLLFSPSGDRVAVSHGRRCLLVVTAGENAPAPRWVDHGAPVLQSAFNREGTRLLLVGRESISLWDAASGARLGDRVALDGEPPDGGFPNAALRVLRIDSKRSGAGTIWDLARNRPVGGPVLVGKFFQGEVLSPDGTRMLTCARGSARVWDTATGDPLTDELAHDHLVHSGAFSPDNLLVATATADGVVRLWDVRTSLLLAEAIRHQGAVTRVAFSPDGTRLASASEDGVVRAAPVIVPRDAAPPWLPLLAEGTGGLRVRETGILAPTEDQFATQTEARRLIEATPADDPLGAFGRWFFDDSIRRPVAPGTRVGRDAFVARCIESDLLDLVQEAREVAPDNARVNEGLAQWRLWIAKARSLMAARRFEDALPYIEHAARLAPASIEMQELRRRLLQIMSQSGGEPAGPIGLAPRNIAPGGGGEGAVRRAKPMMLRRRFPGLGAPPSAPEGAGAPPP